MFAYLKSEGLLVLVYRRKYEVYLANIILNNFRVKSHADFILNLQTVS